MSETNLSLLMRLGDFAPKILEERRKLELPREGDKVYLPSRRVGRSSWSTLYDVLGPRGNVEGGWGGSRWGGASVAQRGPRIQHPAVTRALKSGGYRAPYGGAHSPILDPKRGGYGRRGEGEEWAQGRARRGVDTNELYDRAIAEQLDFISKRETRGVDIEGGGAVGGVDPERSRYHPLFDPEDRPEDPYAEPEPKRTLPIPAAMRHFDPPPTDEQIREFMADLGSGRVWVTSPTRVSSSYEPAGGVGDEDL